MPMPSPRVTAADPADGQVQTTEETMLAEGFDPILGTGRMKTAGRAQQRGNGILVHLDQKNEQVVERQEQFAEKITCFVHASFCLIVLPLLYGWLPDPGGSFRCK